jgi:hypothetical protein
MRTMKNLFLLLFLSSYVCHAQVDSSRYKAGVELIKFNKVHAIGSGLKLAGIVVTLASSATITTDLRTTAFVAASGTILTLVGYVVEATAYKHIKRAGLYLEGDSIIIPLDHRRRRKD